MPVTSREDFDALIRRSGLALPADEVSEIYVGWGYVEPMLARIRHHERGREIEPAHVFRPDVSGTQDA